jgi:hypothetical protein
VALLIYTIAIFGFVYIVGHARISLPVREWIATTPFAAVLALIECPACLSWWCGLGAGFGGFAPIPFPSLTVAAFALAFYSAGSSYLLARLTGLTPAPGDRP